ncbi:DUF6861 domain-containing protein [Massilia sp. W12]|uniref:DUF6861 domain-containing protein n=1 Tax=Massilia sp. W12 TaxID=3126507 RepID=UPI0030D5B642
MQQDPLFAIWQRGVQAFLYDLQRVRLPSWPELQRACRLASGDSAFGMTRDACGAIARGQRVMQALEQANAMYQERMHNALGQFHIASLLPLLEKLCKELALYLGGGAALGALLGGAAGALAAGVGAAPGAAAGAVLGTQIGAFLLNLVGIAEVAQYLVHTMPQVLQSYKLGFWDAWGPMPHTDRMALGKVSTLRASQHFAEGHMLFTLALLSALLAWFTRGKGEAQAMLASVRAAPALGERFAQWLSQHGAAASRHPLLQVKPPVHAHASSGPKPAGSTAAPGPFARPAVSGPPASPPPRAPAPTSKPATAPIPSRPPLTAAQSLIGQSQGGPGVWQAAPLRAKGVEYQELVTGVERGVEYAVEHPGVPSGKVLFDGYDPVRKVLIDAKDWEKFPPLDAEFWYAKTRNDAKKQIEAARGMPIEWHFSTLSAKNAVRDLLNEYEIKGIRLLVSGKE